MENIYKPTNFYCTEVLDVATYFNDFSEIVLDTNLGAPTVRGNLSNLLEEVKHSAVTDLQDACSINHLTCPNELGPIELPDTILSQHKLHITPYPVTMESKANLTTIATREKFKKKPVKYAQYRHQVRQEFETNIMKREKSLKPLTLKPNKDLAYTIRIYQPFFYKFSKRNHHKKCKYSHEIVALGSNTLAEVRDMILCKNDAGICQETDNLSTSLQAQCSIPAKEIYPSNFIFIENVFYNDFRHPQAIDYSEVVIRWAQKWKVGNFQTVHMDKVKLSDLKVRIGYPYVYQHQAECEHMFVFSDIAMLKSSDFLNKNDYPYYKNIARYNSQQCMICGLRVARWICISSPRLPADNTFFCQECCLSYNYIDGKKIDDVKVFPYFDRSIVL